MGSLEALVAAFQKTVLPKKSMHSMANESGNIIFFIIIGFIIIALLPPIAMMIWPPVKLLFQVLMIFIIYSIVRGYLGNSALTIMISAVLIYFMVFKYTYIFATLYVFQMLLGVQFISVMIWGIGTRMRRE